MVRRIIPGALVAALVAFAGPLPAAEAERAERTERAEKAERGERTEKRARKDERRAKEGLDRGDRAFIDKAMKDGQAEIAMGKLAQERGSSPAVKAYGRTLVDDHTKAGQELDALAARLGYTPPEKAKKEPRENKRLAKLEGEKFDREFAKHMVKDHEKAVKLFRKQAQDSENQELWQFANKTLPVLEQHLATARGLAGEKERRARKDG